MNTQEELDYLYKVNEALTSMPRETFRAALKLSIGASADYADGCYINFIDNPIAYMSNRNPQKQSLALLECALKRVRGLA